jgi:hypothetical protein
MTVCIKCNLREAIPGGNLCEQDSKLSGGGTTYIYNNPQHGQVDESGNQSAPPDEDNGGSGGAM